MVKKSTLAWLAAAGGTLLALGAAPAHADARGHLHIGVRGHAYTQPAPVYVQPGSVYGQPGYLYAQPAYVYTRPGHVQYHRPYHNGFRGRDADRDGIPDRFDRDRDNDGRPNWRDRDRDGDGVPNRWDRRPDNRRRY